MPTDKDGKQATRRTLNFGDFVQTAKAKSPGNKGKQEQQDWREDAREGDAWPYPGKGEPPEPRIGGGKQGEQSGFGRPGGSQERHNRRTKRQTPPKTWNLELG